MTKLLYFDDTYQFTAQGGVEKIQPNFDREGTEDGRTVVILDQTIFYPQGGGQPYDTGKIFTETAEFRVEEVRFIEDEVHHIGQFVNGEFELGQSVHMEIDEERRRLNARNHSAGHLMDEAMKKIGQAALVPTKGFHFPEGPYVEYEGDVDPESYEEVRVALEKTLNEMIAAGGPVEKELQDGVHASGKPERTVQMGGGAPCPCGGTHVHDVSEIGPVEIRKVKSKKGTTKVAYQLS